MRLVALIERVTGNEKYFNYELTPGQRCYYCYRNETWWSIQTKFIIGHWRQHFKCKLKPLSRKARKWNTMSLYKTHILLMMLKFWTILVMLLMVEHCYIDYCKRVRHLQKLQSTTESMQANALGCLMVTRKTNEKSQI